MVDTSDLLPKTPRYLKVPLIILNAVLWVLGIILISLGGYASSKLSNLKELINISLPVGIIVIGVFFVILTIVGCVVAYKEKLVGLVVYTVFMLILLVCLIGVGGGAFTYRNDAETPLLKAWNLATHSEKGLMEDYFVCCGWSAEVITTSKNVSGIYDPCLTYAPENDPTPTVRNSTYGPDYAWCGETIVDFVQKNLYIAGAAGLSIGIIEFIAMLFALFLIVRICNSPRSKSYD
ncbi:tetraspanin family protein [Cavenderia fasciculata]|uniref:Tetraspanin family protein n=1 Tax=Cavenderia fasciculata TaxID=261658 RepID=F4PXT2_CACFS|nr:tetraspanin family protein [Cavenderia fasciculata]EGG19592.1 tetraspanin family protein [Cavenderia fasciculata]|eukprot:XP_004357886.1 tetraspanin family protein [Cavenderia fasciculata]